MDDEAAIKIPPFNHNDYDKERHSEVQNGDGSMKGILEENILLGLEAENRNDAIMKIVEVLEANGHIRKSYFDDVIEREKEYPTGLPTEGVKIAIPHASSDAIIDSTIGMAIMKAPVKFMNMADSSDELDVEIIFLIANSAASEQTAILQQLMEKFSDEDVLVELRNAESVMSVLEIIGR